ncbi:AraC family transcriptional regulator [Allostella sp. ATCC 35155]|nr:AraC family transcriptional regulator [Stella sp. ATCC 35155]
MAGIHRATQHRVVLARVEAVSIVSDRSLARHSHDHFGIGVLVFGAHRSWSGLGAVEAEPGALVSVNPGEVHDGAPVAGRARGWRTLYFAPALVAAIAAEEDMPAMEIARPAFTDPPLARLTLRLFRLATAPPGPADAAEEALVATLACTLRRHGSRRPGRSPAAPDVRRAVARIDAAPEEPMPLTELARVCGTGRFGLVRAFAREMGVTPHAYRIDRRVHLARRLLAGGQTPAAAAAAAGFADQSHLTRAFARRFGVTPARYRAAVA